MPFIDRGYNSLTGRRKRQQERLARLQAKSNGAKNTLTSSRSYGSNFSRLQTPTGTPNQRSRAGSSESRNGPDGRKFTHDYSNVRKVGEYASNRNSRDTNRYSANESVSSVRSAVNVPFRKKESSSLLSEGSAGQTRPKSSDPVRDSEPATMWRKQPKMLRNKLSTIMSQGDLLTPLSGKSSLHSSQRTCKSSSLNTEKPDSPRPVRRPTDPDVKQVLENLPILWQTNKDRRWSELDDDEMFRPNVSFLTLVHVAKWCRRLRKEAKPRTRPPSRKASMLSLVNGLPRNSI